jgi:hypothetical protein
VVQRGVDELESADLRSMLLEIGCEQVSFLHPRQQRDHHEVLSVLQRKHLQGGRCEVGPCVAFGRSVLFAEVLLEREVANAAVIAKIAENTLKQFKAFDGGTRRLRGSGGTWGLDDAMLAEDLVDLSFLVFAEQNAMCGLGVRQCSIGGECSLTLCACHQKRDGQCTQIMEWDDLQRSHIEHLRLVCIQVWKIDVHR